MIDEFGTRKVSMYGVMSDCEKLKPIIEELYNKHIFYLSYWESEAPFHGWSWSEDDGTMANMAKITDGITERFKEIYALILSGLGMRFEKNADGVVSLIGENKSGDNA